MNLEHGTAHGDTSVEAAARRARVLERIAAAARIAGRDAGDIRLIAVAKTHGPDAVRSLIAAGHRDFGENRVQEAQGKWPQLIAEQPEIRLHMVGQLQSNKADDAVRLFDVVHSVDRPSLVSALARAMDRNGRRPDCFVQVNLSQQAHRGGCAPSELAALLALAREADLPVCGLMTVPPPELAPAPWFALLAKLADDHGLAGLSMGMSGDYEIAVKLGATHVRVGTALFGDR